VKTALSLILLTMFMIPGLGGAGQAGAPAKPAPGAARPTAQDSRGSEGLVRVNGHVITRKELQAYYAAFHLNDQVQAALEALSPVERERLVVQGLAKALPELVEQRLLLAAAEEQYPDTEALRQVIEEMLAGRLEELRQEKGSMVAVVRAFHRRGLSLQQWKDLMADAILVQSYMWPRVKGRVRVSPTEMRDYYERESASFRRPRRVVYRAILVDPAGCDTPEEERVKAEAILERIREGADFGELAELHSIDRASTDGGLHEVEAPETPPDWLPPLCEGLKPGEVSAVRETPAGFCIVRLEQVVPSRIPAFQEVQDEIRAVLTRRKTEEVEREVIEKLRAGAHVEWLPGGRQLMRSSPTLNQRAAGATMNRSARPASSD